MGPLPLTKICMGQYMCSQPFDTSITKIDFFLTQKCVKNFKKST